MTATAARPARPARPADAVPVDVAPRGVERSLAPQRRKFEAEIEQLVEAAFRVMRMGDTAEPTVSEILAEAGLSTSAFYRHFPTKDDLLVTLLQRANEMTLRHIDERIAACRAPEQRIAAWVGALFDLLRSDELVAANRPFLLAHPRLLDRFPAEITAGFDSLLVPLHTAIAESRRAAQLPEGDPALDARLVLHQVFGMLIDAAALRKPVGADLVDAVVTYTLRAVLSPEPVPRPEFRTAGARRDRAAGSMRSEGAHRQRQRKVE